MQKILQQDVAEAILFNCCSVEDISAAFSQCGLIFENYKHIKFGAYANAFGKKKEERSPTNGLSQIRDDISPTKYLEYARKWKQQGASIIGGCCGVGPEYIEHLSKKLID